MRLIEIAVFLFLIVASLQFVNSKYKEIDNELNSQLQNFEERIEIDLKYCVDARDKSLDKAVIEQFDRELLDSLDYYKSIIKSLNEEGFEVEETHFHNVFVYCKENSLEIP